MEAQPALRVRIDWGRVAGMVRGPGAWSRARGRGGSRAGRAPLGAEVGRLRASDDEADAFLDRSPATPDPYDAKRAA